MPNETVQYQCPACTGPLHYGQQSGKLECDYCGSSFTVAELEQLEPQGFKVYKVCKA